MKIEKTKTSIENKFGDFLREHGQRRTPERYVILRKVMSMSDHFYVETLHNLIEEDGYHISRATVYNTMQLLIEFGAVRRHQFADQPAQYEKILDSSVSNHNHLICQKCGKIKEVDDPILTRMLNDRRYQTFQPQYFTLYVYGICSRCQRRMRRNQSTTNKNNKK